MSLYIPCCTPIRDPHTLPQLSLRLPFHFVGSEKILALFTSAIIIIFAFPVESLDALTAFLLEAMTEHSRPSPGDEQLACPEGGDDGLFVDDGTTVLLALLALKTVH